VPPLGSNTRITHNQNAIRSRKRMTYPIPRPSSAALERTLAGRLESAVRGKGSFLFKLKVNEMRIFIKLETNRNRRFTIRYERNASKVLHPAFGGRVPGRPLRL
jgi:hypothetical protein